MILQPDLPSRAQEPPTPSPCNPRPSKHVPPGVDRDISRISSPSLPSRSTPDTSSQRVDCHYTCHQVRTEADPPPKSHCHPPDAPPYKASQHVPCRTTPEYRRRISIRTTACDGRTMYGSLKRPRYCRWFWLGKRHFHVGSIRIFYGLNKFPLDWFKTSYVY